MATKKTRFEKAAMSVFGQQAHPQKTLLVTIKGVTFKFRDLGSLITSRSERGPDNSLRIDDKTTVGDICKFIHMETLLVLAPDIVDTPIDLGGNGKDFEKNLMDEAKRLETQGELVMGRYGTMVSMIKGEWMPVPSLPDFEGVLMPDGRQFIIEAKVCSQSRFRIQKDKIKHKQVRHMLSRSKFGVPCFVMIHFNERQGATFYDPPFTVAVPVKSARKGGWPVWEQYAAEKDKTKEFPSITRELATEIGEGVRWKIAPRGRTARPDLLTLLESKTYE